ncbi:MAG: serine/threonine-protein kinase [Micrococcus sp.]|nr:serine/threonine-protein kinase [Micrococcus sp.]
MGQEENDHDGAHAHPQPPPVVAGWEIVDRLGEGGHAVVWKVRDEQGRLAALKVPAPGRPDTLEAEAATVRHHRHPHLVTPLGTVPTDQGTGLLSDYLAGGTVTALLQAAGPLTVGQTLTVLVPIAQALASLHAASILHGDVSPSNILFDVSGAPLLADLGTAKVLGAAQRIGGTPGFCAPEMDEALATGVISETLMAHASRADVYALCAVGWFCLTGRLPGREAHRAPLPLLVPEVPDELARVLESGMAVDPTERPTAEALAAALYATAPCEPVRLHAAVDPETALILPTVYSQQPVARRRRARSRAAVRPAQAGDGRRAGSGDGPAAGRWDGRRTVRVATIAAVAGLVVTGALVVPRLVADTDAAAADSGAAPVPAPATSAAASTAPASTAAASTASSAPPSETSTSSDDVREPAGAAQLADQDVVGAQRVLDRIGAARSAIMADPTQADLAAYAVAGGPAHTADAELVDRLVESGVRFAGVEHRVVAQAPAQVEDEDTVLVDATLATSAHRVLSEATGEVLDTVEASAETPVTLVLRRHDGDWHVWELQPRR